MILGNIVSKTGKTHQWTVVNDTNGTIGTLLASDYKAPPKILVNKGEGNAMIEVIGRVLASTGKEYQRQEVYAPWGTVGAVAAQDHPKKFPVKDENGKYRIRRITPREAYRLMGFTDEEFDKAKGAGTSDTQLYRQAGNSIVVNVLADIMQNLYNAMPYLFDDLRVGSYFSGIGAFESALDRLSK